MKIGIVSSIAAALLTGFSTQSAEKMPFSVAGVYVEGCSCAAPCPCELVGVAMGCEGVGGMELTGGKYKGVNLAGAKLAYAVAPGSWLYLYVDANDDKQRKAALAFAKAYYKDWGELKSAKAAKISIQGKKGAYTLTVDDGKIMTLKTEPVLGGDGKSPIKISNTKSSMNDTFMQGRTVSCQFKDGDREFKLKGSNCYFNPKMKAKGNL